MPLKTPLLLVEFSEMRAPNESLVQLFITGFKAYI